MLQKALEWTYNHFHKSTSKMLIYTGAIGWALSSAAQIMAIVLNPKISKEKKSFLIPQETSDAVTNIALYVLVTKSVKELVAKAFKTGKLTVQSVKESNIYKQPEIRNNIGKIDFNLENVLKQCDETLLKKHNACKNLVTTVAAISAGIISSSILTPIIRNKMAANVQKTYIDNKDYIDNEVKRRTEARMAKLQNKNHYPIYNNYSSGIKI